MEAMIPIGKRPMVDYVLHAVLQASIRRIVVVGPMELAAVYQGQKKIAFVSGGRTHLESLKNGIEALKEPSQRLLIVTGDLPLITAEVINRFLDACQALPGNPDLVYPIISRNSNQMKYPNVKRTYVHLKEGTFTGGNVFYSNPMVFQRVAPHLERLIQMRKKPLSLAWLLGWTFLVKLVLGRLAIDEVEKKISQLFDINGTALISEDCELGIDVDKPSDLALVSKILTKL